MVVQDQRPFLQSAKLTKPGVKIYENRDGWPSVTSKIGWISSWNPPLHYNIRSEPWCSKRISPRCVLGNNNET